MFTRWLRGVVPPLYVGVKGHFKYPRVASEEGILHACTKVEIQGSGILHQRNEEEL